MSNSEIVTLQEVVELLVWIAVLIAVHLQGRFESASGASSSYREAGMHQGAFKAFALLKIAGSLAYLVTFLVAARMYISSSQADFIYNCAYWSTYLLQTVVVFFVMSSLIRSCLRPLPGLWAAANVVFRWASMLAFALALTAHLPTLRIMSWHQNLTALCFSFQFCVCSFEITLTWMLLKYMRKLGLFVRSRVVGFTLGLAAFGLSVYLGDFTGLAIPAAINTINIVTEFIEIGIAAFWLYYILMPEPERQPHSLSPASNLMKWNEVALKLGMGGRQAEQVPFISGVESKVDAVLDRFKARAE